MITIGIHTSLLIHVGTGSMKIETAQYEKNICADYWWTNLLYINNLYPFPGILRGCMGWSWYLANDMQFYIISPLFIILLYNHRTSKLGIAAVIAMCVSSIIVTATLTGYYGLPVGKSFYYYNDRMLEFPDGTATDVTYGKPWCRIQSYMVGVFVGYFLYRHIYIKKIRMHWLVPAIGWFFAIGIMYAMLYALHGTSNQDPPPQWFSAVWGGVCRALFSMGVAWVAFACSTGYGGLINSFLSWSFWTPMARLTYCAYLLHPIVIFEFLRTKKISYHWTFPEVVYFTFANIVVSYVCALGLSLLVESPTVGIEKAIFGKKKR